MLKGKDKGVAYEIAVGEDVQRKRIRTIYVNNPLNYKGFEFYIEKEGYSPLFVLRDRKGTILYGAYVTLQSIMQEDGTYIYRSGTATEPGSFIFPQDPEISPVFRLQTTFYPEEENRRAGDVLFQGWRLDPSPWAEQSEGKELFRGKVALGEKLMAGNYFLSMDEVRYWAGMKVIYRPGLMIIYSGFWIGFGGLVLSAIQKMTRERKGQNINSLPLEGGG